jgi:hypothetical protein
MGVILAKIYTKGKIKIIFTGGGGSPLVIQGIKCDSNNPVDESIAIGYNTTSSTHLPVANVTAVVVMDTSTYNISGLNQLYQGPQSPKIELALEQSLEAPLFAECQVLFQWNGSLSDYFTLNYIT